MAPPAGAKTIIITGTYKNFISGAGETGFVDFVPSLGSVNDTAGNEFLTLPPFVAIVQAGTGAFSIPIPTTDNDAFFPTSFTYTIIEKVSNMGQRTTKGVRIPSTLGSTADLSDILANYLNN
jgi:hypothetical protein